MKKKVSRTERARVIRGKTSDRELVAAGYAEATPGLYYDDRAHPYVTCPELLPFISPQARMSWIWVLGETGVWNNPSRVYFAIAPGARKRTIETTLGPLQINGMAPEVFFAGSDKDNLDGGRICPQYICATPERALCDWIYITRRLKKVGPEQSGIELDGVSVARMRRLAEAMGIRRQFDKWYDRWVVVWQDEEVVGQYSKVLGY